jgi:hypothetical protein
MQPTAQADLTDLGLSLPTGFSVMHPTFTEWADRGRPQLYSTARP